MRQSSAPASLAARRRFFALAGARVALIERRPDPARTRWWHASDLSAQPTIERLGLTRCSRPAARFGSASNSGRHTEGGFACRGHSSRMGRTAERWIRWSASSRIHARVELLLGETVVALLGDDGRPAGVQTTGLAKRARSIRHDWWSGRGRGSTVARLGAIRGASGRTTVLSISPTGAAYAHERRTHAHGFLTRRRCPVPQRGRLDRAGSGLITAPAHEVRGDLERAYMGRIEALTQRPDLSRQNACQTDRKARDAERDAIGGQPGSRSSATRGRLRPTGRRRCGWASRAPSG